MRALLLIALLGCGDTSKPVSNTSNTPPPPSQGSGCKSAHDCQLRSVCGCSCEAVLLSAPKAVPCEESCPDKNVCEKFTVFCEMSTGRCGALPKGN